MTTTVIPFDYDGGSVSCSFFDVLMKDFFASSNPQYVGLRAYNMMSSYYGVGGERRTLEAIGQEYGVTRERVRQIVANSRRYFRMMMYSGKVRTKYGKELYNIRINQDYKYVLSEFWGQLSSLMRTVENESTIVELAESTFGTDCIDLGALRFALESMGYVRQVFCLSKRTSPPASDTVIWGRDKKELEQCVRHVNSCYRLLQKYACCANLDTLQNKTGIDNKSELRLALSIPEDIEVLNDDFYQIRYEALGSVVDKIYRILKESNRILTLPDICTALEESEAYCNFVVNKHHVSTRMSQDPDGRFSPIGKSGYWGLYEWGMKNKTIVDLMREAFGDYNSVLSNKYLREYVSSRRPVGKNSVAAYLNIKDEFVNCRRGEWQWKPKD